MSDDKQYIEIDESTHERVPKPTERLKHAGLAMLLGFILINIVGFWMFPGPGIYGFHLFATAHSLVGFVAKMTNIIIITILAICGVYGWFRGIYFTDRIKGYIEWWKFW